jgi:hypothetical protein
MNLSAARSFDSLFTRRLLAVALGLTIVALIVALVFVLRTTGGTLFLFTTVTPALVCLSVFLVAYALVQDYRERHRLFRIEEYDAGDVIIREDEEGQCAYFIRSGEVEVVRGTDGEVLARRGPGEYFGEMALLSNEPRSATVRAIAPTRVVVLGKQNFLEMIRLLPTTEQSVLETVRQRAMEARCD